MLLPGLAEPLGQEVHTALPVIKGLEVSPALLADSGTDEALGESQPLDKSRPPSTEPSTADGVLLVPLDVNDATASDGGQ
ncbi:MAG: hypothetical protein A2V77_16480 [Anaeromyxobacter sp. RBG_16_69_14]|nr:MAG: hypothetical protein A2V77_16480 [Anaeromyxobacter sp. RBG_16_69_14]